MSYWNHLWRVEVVALISLVVYALGLTAVLKVGAAIFAPGPPSIEGAALSFGLILLFGVIPAAVFFAPAYAFLRSKRKLNLFIAIVVGLVASGMFVALFKGGVIALCAFPSGAIVAAGVHTIMRGMR